MGKTYRLDPVEGQERHGAWLYCLIGASPCWVQAETASEAIAALDRHKQDWDLAIVDLFLKEGSGLGVLRAAQDRSPHQHMLVLTNYPTAEIRRRCRELGADGVFDKSTELEAFFDLCRSYGV